MTKRQPRGTSLGTNPATGKPVRPPKHGFDADLDACRCGSQWVYHEHGSHYSYGCEAAGKPLHKCCEGRAASNRHVVSCDNYVPPARKVPPVRATARRR